MELKIKRFEELALNELYELLRVRVSVFVVEQCCPYQEIDGKDFSAFHVFYEEDGCVQAYVRVLPQGDGLNEVSIGRVLTAKRGDGLGRKIMLEGIRVAREKLKADCIRVEAQTYARGFYERLGFRQSSDEFLEDGIPHIEMLLSGI